MAPCYEHTWHIIQDDKTAYRKLKSDVTPMLKWAAKEEYISPPSLLINKDHIVFFGPGDDFYWPNDAINDTFCVNDLHGYTGRKFSCDTYKYPYDKIVCAFLIRAKHYYKDKVKITSTGNWNSPEWQKAKELYWEFFHEHPADILEPKIELENEDYY